MTKTRILASVLLAFSVLVVTGSAQSFSSRMCNPFAPKVKPLSESEIKHHKCFSLEAYPLGKRNHVHLTFRQWPIIDEPHCQHFVASNISLQAFNKYSWPFGRWLTSSLEQPSFCTYEDHEMTRLSGSVEDCTDLLKLDYVSKNLLTTVSQDTVHSIPGRRVNMFKYGFHNNKGGICTTWRYMGRNFSLIVASELGGVTNARKYFANFHVTFFWN